MTTNAAFHDAMRRFFEAFVEAFGEFDGHLIARRYAVPYRSVDASGASRRFDTRTEIGDHFAAVVADYRRRGCRACRFTELDVEPGGPDAGRATVTWTLVGEDDRIVGRWRESYELVRGDSGFVIVSSTDQAG
jgi:hypothetical protein